MPEIRPAGQQTGVKQYGRIDLVVCLDTTGSMDPIIDAVREHIVTHLIGEMKGQLSRNQMPLEWRARVIGYGDLDADPFYSTPFTSDEGELVRNIRNVTRSGGGTEYSLDALLLAGRSPWRSDAPTHRIVVLFTDEPSHPRLHTSNGGGAAQAVIDELASQRVKLFLFGVEDITFNELRKLPKSDVTLFPEADIHTMLAKLDFRKIFEQMAKTISDELVKSPATPTLPSRSM
jgi:hypothetical protein